MRDSTGKMPMTHRVRRAAFAVAGMLLMHACDSPLGEPDENDVRVNGVALYPGAKVIKSDIDRSSAQGGTKITIEFAADDPVDEVRSYYREGFSNRDGEIDETTRGFSGTTAGGNAFRLELNANRDGGTRGRLTAGD